MKYLLPSGLTCDGVNTRCVFQWYYGTGKAQGSLGALLSPCSAPTLPTILNPTSLECLRVLSSFPIDQLRVP